MIYIPTEDRREEKPDAECESKEGVMGGRRAKGQGVWSTSSTG